MDLWRRLCYFPVYYYIKNTSEPKQHVALADITTISPVKWWHKHNWIVNHVSIPRVVNLSSAILSLSSDFGREHVQSQTQTYETLNFSKVDLCLPWPKVFAWDTLGRILTYHSEILETIKKITTPLKGVLTNSPWAKTPCKIFGPKKWCPKSLKRIGTTTKMTGKQLLLPSQIPLQWWASFQQYQLHSERPRLNGSKALNIPKLFKYLYIHIYIYYRFN